jgi:hypothetical protein
MYLPSYLYNHISACTSILNNKIQFFFSSTLQDSYWWWWWWWYLENIKWCLLLDTETPHFVMVYKIKIYILSDLFSKIFIPCHLSITCYQLYINVTQTIYLIDKFTESLWRQQKYTILGKQTKNTFIIV